MNSYLQVMGEQIHVMYVDHELEDLINVTTLLETCYYRVTHFQFAAAAIQALSNGKVKFDFIIANINSPDFHGCNLLQLAVNMKVPIILMSIDDNTSLAMRAIEKGAFLFVKKPITLEMVSTIWQHVAIEMKGNYVNATQAAEFGGGAPQYFPNINPNVNIGEDDRGKRVVDEGHDMGGYNVMGGHDRVRRRVCTEWTQELHERFMYAVEILGEGRCFPKEILELMNVPGLTRMQVASHLQKCRKNSWRPPQERRSALGGDASSSNGGRVNHRPRKFGSMPQIDKPAP